MVILGIDPGYAIVGYGLVTEKNSQLIALDYGVIRTSSSLSLPERLVIINQSMTEIIEKYNPDEVAIEELFFAKNTKTAMSVAHARGVLVHCASAADRPIFEYRPNAVKQAITGFGKADKKQIQNAICLVLGLKEPPKPDDAADALAVAICHSNNRKLNLKTANMGN